MMKEKILNDTMKQNKHLTVSYMTVCSILTSLPQQPLTFPKEVHL